MNTTTAGITPAEALAAIINAGVARFEASLPAYARRSADDEPMEVNPNLRISVERQREICLRCEVEPDCVGVGDERCPIRIEARRLWRR
jgi:hypothetical protein